MLLPVDLVPSLHVAPAAASFSPATLVDVLPFVLLAGATAAYTMGTGRAWRRCGQWRGVTARETAAGAGALAATLVALGPPLDGWAAHSLTAHMAQHMILILVVAPLLVAAHPVRVLLWSPSPAVRGAARWLYASGPGRWLRGATRQPVAVWVLQVLALWTWHMPAFYQAALRWETVHVLEHATLVAAGCLFWRLIFTRPGRAGQGATLAVVFATAIQMNVLAALLIFSTAAWYDFPGTLPFGFSPLQDQQVGGVVMWVPGEVFYVLTAAAVLARWLRSSAPVVRTRAPLLTPRATPVLVRGHDRPGGDHVR